MNAASPPFASTSALGIKTIVVLTSIVSAIGASLLGVAANYCLSSLQTRSQQRVASVTKFVDASQQFDRSVAEFMEPFLQYRDADKEKEALRRNIQDQFLALEQAETILPPEEGARAKAFKEALVEVDGKIGQSKKPEDAAGLIQAIADARDRGVCVTYYLRYQADMSVSDDDAEYCKPGVQPKLKPLVAG